MDKITGFFIGHRRTVLAAGILLTLFWASNLINLRIDGSFSSVLPDTDADYLFNKSVEADFGSSDEIIVLIRNSNAGIFTRDAVLLMDELARRLSEVKDIDGGRIAGMTVVYGKPVPAEGASEDSGAAEWDEYLKGLEAFMADDPLVSGVLASPDGTTAVLTAPVSGEVGMSDQRLAALVGSVKVIAADCSARYPESEVLLSGHPVVNAEIMEKMANDLYVLFPVAVLATALMLLWILRSVRGMLIPLVITLMSVIWTLGLKGLLRSPLTITETVIPVILISISCADGIHIVSEAFHFMHHGDSAETAIKKTVSDLWKPVILTSLTTALGFTSFVFSSGKSLRNMGLFLAFGVMTAMIFSLFFIPVLFSWYKPLKSHEDRKHYKSQYRVLRRIERTSVFFIRHRLAVLFTAVAVLAFSVAGMLNMNTDTDEIRYFREDNPVRLTAELIEQELGGLSVLQIVLEGGEGSFRKLQTLKEMESLQQQLEARPEVSTTLSLSDSVSYMYYTMRGRTPEAFVIPDNEAFTQRLLGLMTGGEDSRSDMVYSYVTEDFSRARILVRLNDSSTRTMEALLSDIEPELDRFRDMGLSVGFAGDYLRLSNGRIIVRSQVLSLTVTLGIILVILSVIYRSLTSGLIVAFPVMTAVLMNFAVMWVFRVSLNPATAIIAAVGLGVGIDYAIHIYSRFQLLLKKGGSYISCLVNAVAESARGILSNAVSVGAGFLILLLSVYRIINDMGWIIALSMLTTSLGSLIILPCLLSFRKRIPERKLKN